MLQSVIFPGLLEEVSYWRCGRKGKQRTPLSVVIHGHILLQNSSSNSNSKSNLSFCGEAMWAQSHTNLFFCFQSLLEKASYKPKLFCQTDTCDLSVLWICKVPQCSCEVWLPSVKIILAHSQYTNHTYTCLLLTDFLQTLKTLVFLTLLKHFCI